MRLRHISNIRRSRKLGFLTRSADRNLRKIILRRRRKGRWNLIPKFYRDRK